MGLTCKISPYKKWHQEFASLDVMAESFCCYTDVDGLPEVTGIAHETEKRHLSMDSFTRSLKAVLLYKSNNFPPFWLLILLI
jgi:hypothetical protein